LVCYGVSYQHQNQYIISVCYHIYTVCLDMDINVNNKLGLYKNSHGDYMI